MPLLRIERIEPELSAFAALLREHAERVRPYGTAVVPTADAAASRRR